MAEAKNPQPWLHVIGMGDRGLDTLSPPARRALNEAELLFSSDRLFSHIPDDGRVRHAWQSPLKESLPALKAAKDAGKITCVIATGDPLCFGIGNWLLHHFSRAEMEIHPGISSFALACARMGWAQHEVSLITLHGRPVTNIRGLISPGQKIIILSEDASTPRHVAAQLVELGFGPSKLKVFAHMEGEQESHHQSTAAKAQDLFSGAFESNPAHDLNVIAVECLAVASALILSSAAGLPEAVFAPFGKITKRELRALAVAHLSPRPGDVLWDVGAGSGSVSVEFLRAAPRSRAIAFDANETTQNVLRKNAENFGLTDRIISHSGKFAEINDDELQSLPNPDAIFFGGGLGLAEFDIALKHLRPDGRLVAHAVTLESEAVLASAFQTHGGDMSRISIAHLDSLGGRGEADKQPTMHGYRPAMTVTQWVVQKPRRNEVRS